MKQWRWQIGIGLLLFAGCGAPRLPFPVLPIRPVTIAARTIPPDYYRPADGKTGEALLVALSLIVHDHQDLGYEAARDQMFSDIDDPDDDDVVVSLYTGKTASGVTNRKTAYAKGFNAEHVWPQSQGAMGAARSDLHHLFAVDEATNSGRSNYPFGEVVQPLKIFPDVSGAAQDAKLGKDPFGTTVFEPPDRRKGDVARAILYFFTCYKRTIDHFGRRATVNFDIERRVLLRWHRLDPVDPAEQLRNEAVFQVQNNRNPYVDRPEFVEGLASVIAP